MAPSYDLNDAKHQEMVLFKCIVWGCKPSVDLNWHLHKMGDFVRLSTRLCRSNLRYRRLLSETTFAALLLWCLWMCGVRKTSLGLSHAADGAIAFSGKS